MQVCAQALCLEEMFGCDISIGCLYYGDSTSREEVRLSDDLRGAVRRAVEEMHELFRRGRIPRVRRKGGCRACSLQEICLPKTLKAPVRSYIAAHVEECSS